MSANIAILIDAENVDPSYAAQIFNYGGSLGTVTVREIYGAGIALNEWADAILENTIHPNITLRPNRFKNSSDIALTIGAMEILFAARISSDDSKVDAVILVSSDSDFSPLASHLRAAGLDVIGMGEPGRINPMWPKACTEFVELNPSVPLVRKREIAPAQPQMAESGFTTNATDENQTPNIKTEQASINSNSNQNIPERTAIKIAPSHRERIEIIRSYISKQICEKNGRIKSGELFRALSQLPDYVFDQQRSKRKPIEYLERQFGTWFQFLPGENGACWVAMRDYEPSNPVGESIVTQPDDSIGIDTELVFPQEKSIGTRFTWIGQEHNLVLAGIPSKHIKRSTEILSECNNLRDIYNKFRQAFGGKDGKQYYEMIKSTFTSKQIMTQDRNKSSSQSDIQVKSKDSDILPDTEELSHDFEISAESGIESEQEQAEAENDTTEEYSDAGYSPGELYLIQNGITPSAAAKVLSIVNESQNMRIAYNTLRKEYGNRGIEYFAVAKKYQAASEKI